MPVIRRVTAVKLENCYAVDLLYDGGTSHGPLKLYYKDLEEFADALLRGELDFSPGVCSEKKLLPILKKPKHYL